MEQYSMKSLYRRLHVSISLFLMSSVWCWGSWAKREMRQRASSRSQIASTKEGQRSLMTGMREYFGVLRLCSSAIFIWRRPRYFLCFLRWALISRNLSSNWSCSKIFKSFTWKQVLVLPLNFFLGSRGQMPLRMQSLLKSQSDTCIFLIALLLVRYQVASPRVPFFSFFPILIIYI